MHTQAMNCQVAYHDEECLVGVQYVETMSLEYVQSPFGSPAAEKHTDDHQQHSNHLCSHHRHNTHNTVLLIYDNTAWER